MVQCEDVWRWILRLQELYREHRTLLTDLDAAIGDADHGSNMDRGFTAVQTELTRARPGDVGALLKSVAMILIRTVGGAAGPLYGTFFLRASAACVNKDGLTVPDFLSLFESGVAGIQERGKAQVGDKTMVDTLMPALQSMKASAADGKNLCELLQAAETAAELGMKGTIPLQARKGRASYLGERSIGHQDPGATSAYFLLRAARETWSQARG